MPGSIDKFATFKRKHQSHNIEKLARRKSRRHGVSYDQALKALGDYQSTPLRLPFIQLNSLSSGEKHLLFVEKIPRNELINEGFSCYGVSAISSVPDF